ncbi:LacI family DNA-binding transcriptional regulator [Aestuariimicrobium soli]|uniref:LacI family DNA-binding transcriptional regulator n=1 Tax=Aestuariimicrobium soli TaxID=2035834 RepID=UPI003EB9D98A
MTRTGGRVTLKQVAERAGVSLATASRAINGSGTRQVNADLADRVLTAAAELDYVANSSAQAMARGRTNVLGLIIGDVVDPYFASLAAGVIAEAAASSCLVNLAVTERVSEREREFVRLFGAQQARGVVLAGSRHTDSESARELAQQVAAVEQAGARVVSLGQSTLGGDAVVIANEQGASDLATELLALGHRRFAVLAGPEHLLTPIDRTRGFVETVMAAGCPRPEIVHGGFSRDGGLEAMNELLDRGTEATCVFGVADAVAIGALTACRARGVRVPDDLSLAGFDDIPTLRDLDPQLTTVRLPMVEAGRAAAALALRPMDGKPRTIEVHGEVVVRESTRRL